MWKTVGSSRSQVAYGLGEHFPESFYLWEGRIKQESFYFLLPLLASTFIISTSLKQPSRLNRYTVHFSPSFPEQVLT